MINKELKERLDFIEFRQELLFINDRFSRLMFQDGASRFQYDSLIELFESCLYELETGGSITNSSYETKVNEILPRHKRDYHFAEKMALELYEDGMYTEVFEALYGDSSKYRSHFE